MPNNEELKEKVCKVIDENKDDIISVGRAIWENPEPGYKEDQTSKFLIEKLQALGLSVKDNLAITGFRSDMSFGTDGPVVAVLAELDSLIIPSHKAADSETGAVHACGHNSQPATMYGVALALAKSGITEALAGKVAFIGVPAEEFIDVEYRLGKVNGGKITYCCGKPEMISSGVFDDVSAGLLIHAGEKYFCAESYNGFLMKKITLRGKAAHAGLAPQGGVNALYAANIALSAINAQRETYRDEDSVRVHGIITNGGDATNVIPDCVTMEFQIRAKTPDAVIDASQKVDRAVFAGAMAMGGVAEIETVPGAMPMRNDPGFISLFAENVKKASPDCKLVEEGHRGSSTDMGDLAQIMPVFQGYGRGCSGALHTKDFSIDDEYAVYVESAKVMAMTVIDLLVDNAAACRDICAKKPAMTIDEYLDMMQKIFVKKTEDYTIA